MLDVTLSEMRRGDQGIVTRVESCAEASISLRRLGLVEGAEVEVLSADNPLRLRVGGTVIGLAACCGQHVELCLVDGPSLASRTPDFARLPLATGQI